MSTLTRIDVHSHFFPPAYVEHWNVWAPKAGHLPWPQRVSTWSPQRAIEQMDEHGIAAMVLSLPIPAANVGDTALNRQVARVCNEYAARLRDDHPSRFGFLASLPVTDVDACLAEIDYAFDVLKADGVGMMSNFGDRWPGEPEFGPIFEALNKRKAVVHFHPQPPSACARLVPGVPQGMLEYVYDTGRAIVSLLLSGTFTRQKDIRFIFAHGGGTVPFLAGRISEFEAMLPGFKEAAPNGTFDVLSRLHFDVATAATPPTMAALLALVPVSQLLFGSDYPFLPLGHSGEAIRKLALSSDQVAAIERGNGLRLFPQFA